MPNEAPSLREPPSPLGASGAPDFDAIYFEHASFVWRVLRGMIGVSDPLVQDALQDVFMVVHRRYPEFDHHCSVRTWLFEIAYRVACRYRRQRARNHAWVDLDDEQRRAPGSSPAELVEQNESVRLLGQLLDQLDEDKRMVFVLAEVEGMSVPEIAAVIHVPLNTVYSRLRRARISFNAALARQQQRRT